VRQRAELVEVADDRELPQAREKRRQRQAGRGGPGPGGR